METTPARRDFRGYLPLVLTLIVGALVTAVVFFIFLGQEHARLRADFENMAVDRAEAIRSATSEDSLELNVIADYVSASSELARGEVGPFVQEFARLARRISVHEEDMQVIAFVSAVSLAERASFEALMRRTVDADFHVRELGSNGALRPAGDRARYLPITVMEPEQYSGSLLGLDLSTVPHLRQAIEHAMASGKPTASEVVDLPLSASGSLEVWSFRAVRRAARVSDVGASRTGLLGVCATAFRIDQMVELALSPLPPAGIDLEIRDASAPPSQPPLYYHRSPLQASGPPAPGMAGMSWSTTIEAGERAWTLTAYPNAAFLSGHRSWRAWGILGVGALLTALAGLVVQGRLRRTEQVEAEVNQRTEELAREVAKHRALESALAESRSALTAQVAQLADKNQQIQLLNDTGDALQSCLTMEEAYATVSIHAPRLLPGTSGALLIHEPQKNLFVSVAAWGGQPPGAPSFRAEECWALRRGKPHAVTSSTAALPCPHADGAAGDQSLCIPLSAIGRTIGLLHLVGSVEPVVTFASSAAEQIALALSNLALRSDLRELSIRDPLTGLYNRRYMEEALETEIRRAERKQHTIGLIMLDIDHFKAFNDRFGHAAGDQMLRAIGGLVLSRLRSGDIACRYGGEELLLILPEAGEEIAAQRAEDLRSGAKALAVKHQEVALGPVTISVGVAVYPRQGRSREELLASADAALYQAKEAGRDRVVLSRG